ncbi:Crp/Fnr family transcriptional regulator [Candidatus Bipolaricaulota bacterium]|nr:Crp/Fnr family transcriptional regulator [Candidatus Bipolaricaulota bacterium]
MHRIRFAPKDVIFRQGAPALGWYVLCRGRAKLVILTSRGKRFVLWFCKPGDVLSLGLSELHALSAVAIDHCVVAFVERERGYSLLHEHLKLWGGMWRHLAEREERLSRRLEDLVALGVRERLVRVLLALGEEHSSLQNDGLRIDLSLSHQDLAEMVGASREKVNQNLRRLAENGLIRVERKQITILDADGLRRFG